MNELPFTERHRQIVKKNRLGTYMNVDDFISDLSNIFIESIIDMAIKRRAIFTKDPELKKFLGDLTHEDIPEEKVDEWDERLWHYDVTKWTPKIDNRAFPDTRYENYLYHVLEFNAYELRTEIGDYLETSEAREEITKYKNNQHLVNDS